jgi:hypothetical protein
MVRIKVKILVRFSIELQYFLCCRYFFVNVTLWIIIRMYDKQLLTFLHGSCSSLVMKACMETKLRNNNHDFSWTFLRKNVPDCSKTLLCNNVPNNPESAVHSVTAFLIAQRRFSVTVIMTARILCYKMNECNETLLCKTIYVSDERMLCNHIPDCKKDFSLTLIIT